MKISSPISLGSFTCILLVLLVVSCKDNPIIHESVEPSLGDIAYKQIYYDLFSVRPAKGSNLITKNITAVVVGIVDSMGFHVRDSITAVFDAELRTYSADFYSILSFNTTQTNVTFRTRCYFLSGLWTDHDSTLSTLKYPYPSTELVWGPLPYGPIDFDISDSVIYAQVGRLLTIYNMHAQTTSEFFVSSFDALTLVDNRYIVYRHQNRSLFRFDLLTNASEQFIYHTSDRLTRGLEYYDRALYETIRDNPIDVLSEPRYSLLRYSPTGELLDSVSMDRRMARPTILHGIAYFPDWSTIERIWEFDLSTNTFIGEFLAPSANLQSLRIRNGYVYFSDYEKNMVARFPMEELFTYGQRDGSLSIKNHRKPL